MEEWKEVKLGDTSIVLIDGDRGKNYPSQNDFYSIGYCLFLNAGNVTKNGFSFETNSFISKEKDNILRNGKLQKNDIVITTRGTVGNVAIYDDNVPYKHLRINSGMLIIRGGVDFYPKYLFYYMKSQLFQNQILQMKTGSAQPQLPKGIVINMKILYPQEISTQQKIANILSSLDDKIEVNRRINENLEAQAQALFKSWFVDFEPFKDGEFVESELGMIPKGWRVGNLMDVANLYDNMRKPLSGMERNAMEKKYPYYGATSIMDYVDKYIFDGVYLLMGEDGSVIDDKGFPVLQYVWGKFWPNNHAHVMQGKNGFTTEMLHSLLSITNVKSVVTGAVQAKISQMGMKKIHIVIAPKDLLTEFSIKITPIYDKIRVTSEEISRLASLRDTLLPKLMSGEVDVNDIKI